MESRHNQSSGNTDLKFLEELKKEYLRIRLDIDDQPTRWETYHESGRSFSLQSVEWRLWDSVERLDITLLYLRNLKNRAARKRNELKRQINDIYMLVDEALSHLDPWSWNGSQKSFRGLRYDHENLRFALQRLREAYQLFDKLYIPISLNVEVKKQGSWLVATPLILAHLRDAVYGIQEFLRETSQNSSSPMPLLLNAQQV